MGLRAPSTVCEVPPATSGRGSGGHWGTGGHWLLRTQTGAPGACLKCIVHYWAVMLNKSQFVQIGTDLSLRMSMMMMRIMWEMLEVSEAK